MATSGKITGIAKNNGATTSNYTFWVEWNRNSYSIPNNTSNITVSLKIKCTAFPEGAWNIERKPTVSLSVNGASKTPTISNIDTRNYVECTFATWTGNVTHNSDGSLSCPISASFTHYGSESLDEGTVSGNASITAIPRISNPTVSSTSVKMGSSVTITTNRNADSFTHTLTYSFGGSTGTIATGVGASYKWTVPDLASKILGQKSGTCTITCETYTGATLVGTSTVSITLTVQDASKPTVSSTSVKMGNSVTITTNRNTDAFTHTLTYSFGGSTGTIATGVGASYKWTVPDLASKIPDKKSGTCTITCKTYTGNTLVGTGTVSVTLTVQDTSVPTVSAAKVQMGKSVTVKTNRKSSAFTHKITYEIGGATGTIAKAATTSAVWTPSKDMASYTGNKTSAACTITCKTYNGEALVGTETITITLTVPSATVITLSASRVDMDSAVTIKAPRETSAYTHDLTYSIAGSTGEIKTGVGTEYSWTVPLSLAAKIPNATSGTVTVTCTTRFKNSTTVIGESTETFIANVPNDSSTQPSLSMSLSCVHSLPSKFAGIYVEGKSKVKVTQSASSDYSTIAAYKTTVASASGTSNPYTSDFLTTSGTVSVTGKVTDARGYSTSKTASIKVAPYSRPRIIPYQGQKSIICKRCNSNGTADAGGAYLLIKIGRKYSKVESGGQKNFCKLSYRYKTDAASDAEYSSAKELLAASASSDYVSVVLKDIVPNNTIAYTIQLIAEDDVGDSDVVTVTVPTAFITCHAPEGGHGFTLGGYHDPSKYDVFDCFFDAEFERDVYGRVYGLGKLPVIPENTDFNDYKEFGVYAVTQNAIAKTISNIPVQTAGTLRVWSANGSGTATGNYAYMMQEYTVYDNSATYRRSMMPVNGVWEYGIWKVVDGADAIIDHGTTDGWYWRKFANGTAECWRKVSQTVDITTSWGNVYYGNCEEVTFPFAFYAAPTVNATVESTYAMWLMAWEGTSQKNGSTATEPASFRVVRPTALTGATLIIAYHAIGRWK